MTSQPAQRQPADQRVWVALLALASLGTTAMVTINVWGSRQSPTNNASTPQPPIAAVIADDNTNTPRVLLTLPRFTLTDQSGRQVGSTQLQGRPWIADFIFTRCAGPCPMMTSRMAGLQSELSKRPQRKAARLVSISVDPEHDTPGVLNSYAKLAHADADRWLFLTGPRQAVWQLVRDGFKLPVGQDADNAAMPIFHSQKFVLVDQAGRIRGFYDGLTPEGKDKLMKDLDAIIREPSAPRPPSTARIDAPANPADR